MSDTTTPIDTIDDATRKELDALTIRVNLKGKTLDEVVTEAMAEERAALARSFDRRAAGADNDDFPEDAA